jgi:hypothetical protein
MRKFYSGGEKGGAYAASIVFSHSANVTTPDGILAFYPPATGDTIAGDF